MEEIKQIKMDITPKKSRKRHYFYILVLAILLGVFWAWQGIYLPKWGSSPSKRVVIAKGQGLEEIATDLKKTGLIKSKYLFMAYALLKGKQNQLMAGIYDFGSNNSMPELLDALAEGEIAKVKITRIEGWSLKEIAAELEEKGLTSSFDFLSPVREKFSNGVNAEEQNNFSEEFPFLKEKPDKTGLEGYLFPDTYEFLIQNGAKGAVWAMLKNFEANITDEIKAEITKQKRTLFEVLTMASLLEKEVKSYEDKQLVAGLLWKRLKSGWPLQVDATLSYITGKNSVELSKDDLKIDSPYNTYRYYGLPMGPICNPGLESIKAAVYYKDSSYWFYLTTAEGKTLFSETLEEHNIKRVKYIK